MKRALVALLVLSPLFGGENPGSRVSYIGGTVAGLPGKCSAWIDLASGETLRFAAHATKVDIPYADINTLEYGMRVNRRYVEAVLISPVFLAAKKRSHFLTIGFTGPDGRQQAIVLRVGKGEIRPLLVSLEARTGRRVEYQDEEARKAGKG